jgi:hypothetical protein
MNKDLGQLSAFTRTYLPPNTFTNVNYERPDNEAPAQISKAVVGRVERESGGEIWLNRVTDETSRCMGEESDHEEECKVVSIPKNLKALVFDLVVCCSIH